MENRFSTKSELLKHIGKNEKDNKLVDRMISKGLVYKESGMYVLVDKDVEIERLKKEIEILKQKLEQGTNTLLEKDTGNNTGLQVMELENKLKESESNLEYQIAENEKLQKRVALFQECIRNCYRWAQNVKKDKTPRPEFKEKVLRLREDLPGEDNQ